MHGDFDRELLKDEKIVWTAQPGASLFAPADLFLVPFSLMWGGFALFWEASVLTIGGNGGNAGPPIIFPLVGGMFVVVGLYFIFGRFFYKAYKNRRTFYAVTNQRVIVLTNTLSRNVQATFIKSVPTINKRVKADGSGTLRFGNSSGFGGMAAMCENTGLDFFGSFYGEQPPAFHSIRDAEKVYRMVADIQQGEST